MNSTSQHQPVSSCVKKPAQQPYANAFNRYLIERGYARNTTSAYLRYGSHFLRWTQRSGLDLLKVDEAVVAQFLDDHLPHCDCGWPTRGDRRDAHVDRESSRRLHKSTGGCNGSGTAIAQRSKWSLKTTFRPITAEQSVAGLFRLYRQRRQWPSRSPCVAAPSGFLTQIPAVVRRKK